MVRPSTFTVRYEVDGAAAGPFDEANSVCDRTSTAARPSQVDSSDDMSCLLCITGVFDHGGDSGRRHVHELGAVAPALDHGLTSRMTSSSTGEPSGRLATPNTLRAD